MVENMTPDNQTVTIEFKGTGLEYFKIWIVNLILSILTIGIYSAWATVRKKRYMYGSTLLDGSSFEYHASPITILKGRLIAVALFVIYTVVSQVSPEAAIIFLPVLVIVSPWIIWRSIKFNSKISSFRNVYFGFEGALGKSYLYYLVIPFLLPFLLIPLVGSSILTIFSGNFEESFLIMLGVGYLVFILIIPFIKKITMDYYIDNHRYGQGNFSTTLLVSKFYAIYGLFILAVMGIGIVTSIIMGFFLGGIDVIFEQDPAPEAIFSIIFVVYLLLFIIMFWSKAYLTTRVRNYVYANTKLDGEIQLGSNLEVMPFFWIYLSNFLLVLFTLGLAYPWAVIRVTKYMAETISIDNTEHLNQFISQQQEKQSALGDEVGDVFDVDTGIDF
jgi:uncharacterized membrane protein YjgN (DUF898 family)